MHRPCGTSSDENCWFELVYHVLVDVSRAGFQAEMTSLKQRVQTADDLVGNVGSSIPLLS